MIPTVKNTFDNNNKNLKATSRKEDIIRIKSGFYRWVSRVLNWLQQMVGFNHQSDDCHRFSLGIKRLLSKFSHVLETRGKTGLISFVKPIRGAYLRYLADSGYTPLECIRLTWDGIPVALGCLIDQVRSDKHFLKMNRDSPPGVETLKQQILLTVLTSTRCLKSRESPSVDSISSPGSNLDLEIDKPLASFWKALGYRNFRKRVPKALEWSKFHFTAKAGPNGHALATWYDDLKVLLQSNNEELLMDICRVGGELFTSKVQTLKQAHQLGCLSGSPTKRKKLCLRRLATFPDKEGKQRVVAIFDYFSQSVLKPLHTFLFQVLKRIPQDCTFDQGSFLPKLEGAEVFCCVDLRAFTDRFPILLIAKVLKGILPDDYVSSWERIMVAVPFDYWSGEISYQVGNPMGAYSSWNSASLAHHFVVFLACYNLKKSWQQLPYCLLGDDIVIGDSAVAVEYTRIINSLGVEIAHEKSYTSPHFIEFAKRWILYNKEISPFPLSALKEASKRYYMLVNVLMNCEVRGWEFIYGISGSVGFYYRLVGYRRPKYCSTLADKAFISKELCSHISGSLTASGALTSIARYLGLLSPTDYITEYAACSMLSNIAVGLFADSHPWVSDNKNRGEALGALAEKLVIKYLSFDSETQTKVGDNLIYADPVLGVYAQFETTYLRLCAEAYSIDTTGEGDWPLLLRSFILPASDKVFSVRSAVLVPMASSVLGKRVQELLPYFLSQEDVITTQVVPSQKESNLPKIEPISFGP